MITLGLRAHDFLINDDLERLAAKVQDCGIHYIQFANSISLSDITNQGELANPGLGLRVQNLLEKYQINIGVLSCYFNLIHPNQQIQEQGMHQFKHYLEIARSYGANIVATEPGSLDVDFKPTDRNYTFEVVESAIINISELTHTAERVGVSVGIEAGINHPIHSLATIQRMFEEVDSPALKLIFDPVNLLNQQNKDQLYDILEDGLKKYSDRIYAIHIKDFKFDDEKVIVAPGQGEMDFKRFFNIVEKYQPGALVILDEAPREGLERGIQLINNLID